EDALLLVEPRHAGVFAEAAEADDASLLVQAREVRVLEQPVRVAAVVHRVGLGVLPARDLLGIAARQLAKGEAAHASSSTRGNERWRRGGTRKFCRCVVLSTELSPWPRAPGWIGSRVPSGRTPSIARRLRRKSSLVGLKTTKWTPAAGVLSIWSTWGC